MITKFDRAQIASINSTHLIKNQNTFERNKKVAVPLEETFRHVFENAKKGNEFAAVLMDEWQRGCYPQNDKEKHVVSLINKAASKIFI